jgi:aminoglycoside phosphotransferase (APT) family kinase protein
MEEFFRHVLPRIEAHLDEDPWRLEILEPIGRSVPELHADMVRIAAGPLEHGPRTLLHGDTHVGNTYLLDEGRMGWLDFQLSHRGCYARDLTYLITTALPIERRRAHERELIAFYFDELRSRGVTSVPDMDTAWTLHRQAAVWGLVIGWLTCPTPNYGREITEENLRRLTQILIDLDCLEVVPE